MRERTVNIDKRKYGTPQPFFDRLNTVFGPFTLDPCAEPSTAKCEKFYTEDDDGLAQDWGSEIVFMNPPFGRHEKACKPKGCKKKRCNERGHHIVRDIAGTEDWVVKAWTASLMGATVVGIVPASTGTKWFHDYVMKAHTLIIIEGRVSYMYEGEKTGNPDFDTIVPIWTPEGNDGFPEIITMKAEL